MLKNILSAVLSLCCIQFAIAQVENPVSWNFTATRKSAKEYEIHMKATVQGNWHIYSQNCGNGPEPTSFEFSKNPIVTLKGKPSEKGKMESMYDPNFKSTLKFYNNEVDFVQKLVKKSVAKTVIKGNVTFMVCNDRKCLPPKTIPFDVKLD